MKPIPGTENRYSVSEDGVVFSHVQQKIRRQQNFNGYKRVCLWYNKKYHMHGVHRLVAMAYIPNPDNLTQVNHIDRNPSNNHVSNLEWCTPQQNTSHKYNNRRTKDINRFQGLKLIALLLARGVTEEDILEHVTISEAIIEEAKAKRRLYR